MAKKEKAVEVQVQKFAVFYSDDECFGVYPSLEEATMAAAGELTEGILEEESLVICALTPKRIVKQSMVVVEDI